MRTSKNRRRVAAEQDIRALAGLPVGRVGSLFSSASLRLSLLLCFSVYTSSLFTFAEYLARSPFPPSSLPLSPSAVRPLASLQRVVVAPTVLLLLLLSYAAAIRTHHRTITPPYRRPLSFVGSPPIVARPQKDANFNSILSNIIYVCMR